MTAADYPIEHQAKSRLLVLAARIREFPLTLIWGTLCLSAFLLVFAGSGSIAYGLVAAITSALAGSLHVIRSLRRSMVDFQRASSELLLDAEKRMEALKQEKAEAMERERELQRIESRSKQNEERMRRIIDAAYDALVVFDTRGKITTFSSRAVELFGTPVEQAIGKSIRSFLEYDRIINDLSAGRPKDSSNVASCGVVESIAKHSDGTSIPVEVSLSMSRFDNRPEFHAFIHDMRTRKAIQARMMHLEKMESIGKLSAGLAHEINTPLQFIGDNVSFLRDAIHDLVPIVLEARRFVALEDKSDFQTDRIAELLEKADLDFLLEQMEPAIQSTIDGLSTVSSITSAMKEYANPNSGSHTNVDLAKILSNCITISRNTWEKVADLEADLGDTEISVDGIASELGQSLMGMIMNAADTIREKIEKGTYERGTIHIRLKEVDSEARIEIEDNGMGIPEAIRSKIFDPFFTTRDVGQGTGQGLTVLHAVIVEKHKGRVQFQSKEGAGTCFSISLPMSASISFDAVI